MDHAVKRRQVSLDYLGIGDLHAVLFRYANGRRSSLDRRRTRKLNHLCCHQIARRHVVLQDCRKAIAVGRLKEILDSPCWKRSEGFVCRCKNSEIGIGLLQSTHEVCGLDGQCTVSAVLVFQDDGDYVGTHDTVIQEGLPNTNNGSLDNFDWDVFQSGSQGEDVSLIRFNQILCGTVRQIPPGSRIESATLTVEVYDASAAPAGDIRMALVD